MTQAYLSPGDLLAARRCLRRGHLKLRAPLSETPAWHPGADLARAIRVLWPQSRLGLVLEYAGLRVRLDLLEPDHLVQAHASTRLKANYVARAAVKAWVAQQLGRPLRVISIALVRRDFEYASVGDYMGLLELHDVTMEVRALEEQVPDWLERARLAQAESLPDVALGAQCEKPACPYLGVCRPIIADYPLSDLRAAPGLVKALQQEGYDDLREIPARRLSKPLHQRIRRAAISGAPEIDEALEAFLRALPYPRYYLDFEAVQFAVPRWLGTRPFESLPFQWACVADDACGQVRMHEFLDLSGAPPMRACAEGLLEAVGDEGPIIVYGDFEGRVVNDLVNRYSDLAPRLRAVRRRIVDLLPWIQKHYYHRDMHGSWSLKAVLPTLVCESIHDGEVQEGLAAQHAYLEAIAETTVPERREALARALREYCRADSEALRLIVHALASGGSES